MSNLDVARTLSNHGFDMHTIRAAIDTAEGTGKADLNGWIIRYSCSGDMIVLHPSWCGIYVGDYDTHIIFQRDISYRCGICGYVSAKHHDLAAILERLNAAKTSAYILCECSAFQYERRKSQVEKLGYTVHHSNISACSSDWSPCVFLISKRQA